MIGLEHILQKKKKKPVQISIAILGDTCLMSHSPTHCSNRSTLDLSFIKKSKGKKEREERHQKLEVDKRENREKGKKGKARLGCSQTINLLNCTFRCTQD